jgi:hypothetical protein
MGPVIVVARSPIIRSAPVKVGAIAGVSVIPIAGIMVAAFMPFPTGMTLLAALPVVVRAIVVVTRPITPRRPALILSLCPSVLAREARKAQAADY